MMKKSRKPKQNNRKSSRNAAAKPPAHTTNPNRRDLLRNLRNGGIGLVILGGAGFFIAKTVHSSISDHDLTKVGNGKPTIVQVHDPECPTCRALQRETKSALKHFDEEQLNYAIANIRTAKGRRFANRYNVPHITLLLFDKNGKLQDILQGAREREELRIEFKRLVSNETG